MLFGKHVNQYYKKYFWQFFFGIIALIFVDVIQTFIPQIVGKIIDEVTNNGISVNNYKPIIQLALYIFAIGVGMFVGRYVWRVCILGEALGVQTDLRYKMFLKSESLTQRY